MFEQCGTCKSFTSVCTIPVFTALWPITLYGGRCSVFIPSDTSVSFDPNTGAGISVYFKGVFTIPHYL